MFEKEAEHVAKTFATQQGIIEFAKRAAEILAEAGRASAKAKGDTPEYAARRWSQVILDEALRILREEKSIDSDMTRRRLGYEEKGGGDR